MITKNTASKIKKLVDQAEHIAVVQGDNPDGDSLGSAVAMEEILSKLDKKVTLLAGTDVPKYLRYISGWERVTNEPPTDIDLIITVDVGVARLLEKTMERLSFDNKKVIVLDHHAEADLEGEVVIHDTEYASAGHLVYEVAQLNEWELTRAAAISIFYSIQADTLGMVSPTVTSDTFQTVTNLIADFELNVHELDNARRELNRKPLNIIDYKATLMQRTEYLFDNQLALTVIPLEEIKQYSDIYNPSALVSEELRNAEEVRLVAGLKVYSDKITGRLREIQNAPFCDQIAKSFEIGGGHPFAAGFKVMNTDIAAVRKQLVKVAYQFLEQKT